MVNIMPFPGSWLEKLGLLEVSLAVTIKLGILKTGFTIANLLIGALIIILARISALLSAHISLPF